MSDPTDTVPSPETPDEAELRRLLDDMRALATREGVYNGNRAVLNIIERVEPLLDAADERDRLARLLDEPRRSGCAVEIAGVRIAPCDERGRTSDMCAADHLRRELAHMTEARDTARQRVAELEAAVERVRVLHYPADNDLARTPRCEDCHGKAGTHPCGCWADMDREPVCGHCNQGHRGLPVAWPCPTIAALGGEQS